MARKRSNSRQNFIAVDKNRLENQGFYGHFQLVDVAYEPEKSLSQKKWLYQDVTCLASVYYTVCDISPCLNLRIYRVCGYDVLDPLLHRPGGGPPGKHPRHRCYSHK